jgi:hypothetical protein
MKLSDIALVATLATLSFVAPEASARLLSGSCICSKIYRPICNTKTGVTYGNQCLADCAKDPGPFETSACHGRPVEDPPVVDPPVDPAPTLPCGERACILLFDPVCSVSTGKTYSNSCFAGIASECEGESSPACISNVTFAPRRRLDFGFDASDLRFC